MLWEREERVWGKKVGLGGGDKVGLGGGDKVG